MTNLGKDYPELGTETWSGILIACGTYAHVDSTMDTFDLFPNEPPEDDDDPELDDPVIV